MGNGSYFALKLVLKGMGMNVEELENKAREAAQFAQEYDLNELRNAMQLMLDYPKHQAQNEMRMIAIMEHLGIPDPVAHSETKLLQKETE